MISFMGMKRIILLILISFSIIQFSVAQVIKGKVTNQTGEPIPYASVYIRELKQGTTANIKGDYEIKVPPGNYLVTYQSLGYGQVFFDVSLTDNTVSKDVILPLQYYQIPEVRISATGEDPAYGIMRKAIGFAPYHLNQISYYKANVYLKGNLIINRIPKLLKKSMKIESSGHGTSFSAGRNARSGEQATLKEGDSFFLESFNEMEFFAPDRYVQKVISIQSTFPEHGNDISPMDFIEASFYQPVLVDMAISPLSPEAFSYYKFRYLGATPQGSFSINKIEVIPKRKSQQLFYGTIYIIDNLWALHSVDLTNENIAGKIRIQQLYVPVQDDIWMPVSHKFEINIGIVGFKADAGYGSSVKYLEVRPNESQQRLISSIPGISVKSTAKDTATKKKEAQIDKILQKDELSNRDMVKLSRLMKKGSEKSLPDSVKKSLEIKDHTTHIIVKDANKKDSVFWASIRSIPLSEIELHSLHIRDSSRLKRSLRQSENDTIFSPEDQSRNKFISALKDITFGHTWSDTSGLSFTNGGLITLKYLNFNTVDGFIIGTDFRISKTWGKKYTLSFIPELRWAFSRKSLMWGVNTSYRFGGMKPKMLTLKAGITSRDINNIGGINPLLNTFTTLFFKENYLKLYESSYLSLSYRFEIVNGLSLELTGGLDDRRVLENTTKFSFSGSSKAYTDNVPLNVYLRPGSNPLIALRDQLHTEIVTNITFTPFQKYRITNQRKIPRGSDWPTFSLTWKHGINEFTELTDKFRTYEMIRFDVNRSREIGAFSEFSWRIRTVGYINNASLTYYDFFHFNSQSLSLLLDNYQDAFMLPSYYSLSTPELFVETHAKYTTPYLILKMLPGLSNTLMRENISISYLGSRHHENYTELGYSISEIMLIGELGIYIGFEDLRIKRIGANLVLRLK
jgi:hypothetical protein